MVNKKRLIASILAILMLVMEAMTLFSCGSNENSKNEPPKNESTNVVLSFVVDDANYATITTTGTGTIKIPKIHQRTAIPLTVGIGIRMCGVSLLQLTRYSMLQSQVICPYMQSSHRLHIPYLMK